jgi:integration host factor subunit beta
LTRVVNTVFLTNRVFIAPEGCLFKCGTHQRQEGKMNKSELIEALSLEKDLTHKRAEQIINLIFNSMAEELSNDGRIEIRGFGSFVVKEYKAYTGRNPKTGETIHVKDKKLPFFKVGKELRERVDN